MDPDQRLEATQHDLFWLPPHVEVHDDGELLATRGPEHDHLFNCVFRCRAHAERAADFVERWHGERETRWHVHASQRAAVAPILRRRGWTRGDEHFGYVLPTAGIAAAEHRVRRVASLDQLRDLLAVQRAAFGEGGERGEEELRQFLAACADPAGRVHRFVVYLQGEPVGGGSMTVFEHLGIGLLWAGGVAPGARGRGIYRALLAARAEVARRRGLAWLGLYGKVDTSGPIVERLGFARCGPMTFWSR